MKKKSTIYMLTARAMHRTSREHMPTSIISMVWQAYLLFCRSTPSQISLPTFPIEVIEIHKGMVQERCKIEKVPSSV